ncbi:hypothetical protein [Phenylobacterium sp.]|uniref:hypothetical protein n=1 Tax=Phenylobacterium sp. TaxID=1871053 RepID=UPI0025E1DC8C|nr:hypothetical protein [Phenylobacterium sp.]
MNRRLQLATLAGALALGAAVGHASADQPHMQAALDSLKAARTELMAATADKGGHRVAALRATNEAIKEVQQGITFDRTH